MSGHDRGRDYRRRKYLSNRPERDDKQHFKRPVILTKSKDLDQGKAHDTQAQPMIILKTREGESRAISPNAQAAASKSKKDSDPSPSYQLAPKTVPPENVSLIWTPPVMKTSVKLLDGNTLQICDGLLEFLTDQTDFLVVGCLGLQGVGKSTVMSHLASLPANISSNSTMFKVGTRDQLDAGVHCTEGIDAYITPDRVILLDCQPILSLSVLSKHISSENPRSSNDNDFQVLENDMEIESLQYVSFILSVCHVVLFIQDWIFDPDLIRFLQAAEMLKPPTPTPSEDEELVEYFPHVMILHTKTKPSYYSRQKLHDLQESYRGMFTMSNLQMQSGMGIANGNVVKTLNPALCEGEPLNLFLLPNFKSKDKNKYSYKGHLGYLDLFKKMRLQIYGVAPTPLSHTLLTEKNWWHYAVKIWDGIKKSSYFPEYCRHMPTAASLKADLSTSTV